jgi:hypothetical protein
MIRKFLVVLFILVQLCGCGPAEENRIATAVLQTLVAKPQVSITDLPTSMPTQTSVPTSPIHSIPTPVPTNAIDLSQITLGSQDLCDEFFAIPPVLIDFSERQIQGWYSETVISVLDAFFFGNERETRYIIGWVILLPENLMGTGFDTVMRHHEYVLVKAVAELGGEEILQRETMPLEGEIGNDSLGLRLLVEEKGEPYRMWVDAILFQRDFIAVTVFEAYQDWLGPMEGIENVASILDKRILEVLRP